jgi:lysophospholipase L1-like esterase
MLVADAVSSIKPAKVYVLLGANDISWMSQSTFITNYGKLIDALKAGTPGAKYYIQSIFPVTAAYEESTGITNDKIDAFNTALAALCAQKAVSYVDAGAALKGADGKLTPAEASGGYNIKSSSYKTWFDYLTEHE